jgi:hypothetical protein
MGVTMIITLIIKEQPTIIAGEDLPVLSVQQRGQGQSW